MGIWVEEMIFNSDNIEIISVNYNTPDYINKQYESIRKNLSDNIKINIIDGSDKNILKRGEWIISEKNKMYNTTESDKNFNVAKVGFNIHHGPGMDLGIRNNNKKYSLILDSDVYIKNDNIFYLFDEYFTENMFCMGHVIYVNNLGYDVTELSGIKYVHPSFMVIDNEKYKKLNSKFIKHGAPCIDVMKEVEDNQKISIKEIRDFLHFNARGTLKIYGLNIR